MTAKTCKSLRITQNTEGMIRMCPVPLTALIMPLLLTIQVKQVVIFFLTQGVKVFSHTQNLLEMLSAAM